MKEEQQAITKAPGILDSCLSFLATIGIPVKEATLPEGSFLPGLSIEKGCIIVDRLRLKHPGDILHEAGHIAVVPASERSSLDAEIIAKRKDANVEELMAIAWSYAACVHLRLDPYLVFHEDGYRGGGAYIAEAFDNNQYFGVPVLQWVGMTMEKKNPDASDQPVYPAMLKWLRD